MLVRPATLDDSPWLYALAMSREVRMNSTRSDHFTYQEHDRWLRDKLDDPRTVISVGEVSREGFIGDRRVGQVRFGKADDEVVEIAISVVDLWRGKGFGRALLERGEEFARRTLKPRRFVALVLVHNIASLRLFGGSGYAPVAHDMRMGKLHVRFEKEVK